MDSGRLMRTLRVGLIAVAAVLLAAAGLTLYNLHALFESRQRSFAAREVLDALTAFRRTIIDAESGQQSFLITGDEGQLAPYDRAMASAGTDLGRLQALTEAEPLSPGLVANLRAATTFSLDELTRLIGIQRRNGFEAARSALMSRADGGPTARFRQLVDVLWNEEQKLLLERRANSIQNYEIAEWGAAIGGAVGLLSLLAFWGFARRQVKMLEELVRTTHHQEEQLRVTLASIGDAVITTDGNGRVSYLNGIAETLTGWTLAEAGGRPLEDVFRIVNEDTRQAVDNPARRVLREGVTTGLANHTILIAKDGVEHPIDDSAAPIRDAGGNVIGVVLIFRDVSERRKDEKAIRDANEKIRLALQSGAVLGIWIWDIPNNVVSMDAQLASVFSIAPEAAAQGLPVERYMDGIHPDDVERVGALIADALRTGAPYRAVYRLRPASGLLWVETSGRVEFDAEGKPLRFPGVVVDITDRRNTERQLELAQSAGGIGTFEWLAGSDQLTVSEEYCRIWGLSQRERASVDELVALVHPEDRDKLGPARIDSANPVENAEFRIRRADTGEVRWLARRGQRIDDHAEDGKAWFAGVISDITDRKRAQDELVESEASFRTLAQAMPVFVWTATPDGQLDWTNEWVDIYSGEPAGTLHGERWGSIVHPEDLPNAAEHWQAAVVSAQIYLSEFRLRRADGSYRWHLTRALPVFDPEGKVRLWVGTNTDIEDQKAASQALAQMNDVLEQQVAERTADRDRIWRLSTDIMLIARLDGVIAAANPAWAYVLGWTEREIAGRSLFDLTHPEDLERARAAFENLADGATIPRIDLRYQHRDGSYRWIAWAAVGGAGHINAVGRDFTAEKMQAEALAATQDALRQSQKMEAVGQLTGGIAHDFNNLLAAISGSLEMLGTRLNQGRFDELSRYSAAAQDAARRASSLTHRLLAFSRRQSLEPKPTNLNRLMAGMDELIRRTVGPEIEIEVIGAGGLWAVLIDRNQMENALLNLCINARDAMPDGGRLTIETANKWLDERAARDRDLPPGQYLSLCVTDTGTGMTPDVIAHAFEPFFTTKPLGTGTGLGLSMTFGFVRQSGGQIRIYSEPGEGTTMCIYLPRYEGDESTDELPGREVPEPGADKSCTVLVVDDEPIIRSLVVEVLEDLGYRTLEAADGAAGLKILRSEEIIDLMITDVGLPGGINGRQLADGGRAVRPDLKILFITGYAENAVVRNGHLERGMQVLTKPFAISDLSARIANLLDLS